MDIRTAAIPSFNRSYSTTPLNNKLATNSGIPHIVINGADRRSTSKLVNFSIGG